MPVSNSTGRQTPSFMPRISRCDCVSRKVSAHGAQTRMCPAPFLEQISGAKSRAAADWFLRLKPSAPQCCKLRNWHIGTCNIIPQILRRKAKRSPKIPTQERCGQTVRRLLREQTSCVRVCRLTDMRHNVCVCGVVCGVCLCGVCLWCVVWCSLCGVVCGV